MESHLFTEDRKSLENKGQGTLKGQRLEQKFKAGV